MDPKTIETKIRKILVGHLKKRGLQLNPKNTESIIAVGILDSLSALELISELEKVFVIKILPDEMTESNFDSILKISNFVIEKLKGVKNKYER
jgi:acyl carrier protein